MTSGGFVIAVKITLLMTVNSILYSLPSNYFKDLNPNFK